MRMVPPTRRHVPRVNIPTKVDYAALTGGIDNLHSAFAMASGRMISCVNFEERFGLQGYHRIDGYERYDGHPQPHLASYSTQYFVASTAEIFVGDTVTGATVSAEVVSVTLLSGTWAASGAGYLILTNVAGSFVNAEKIKVGGLNKADASGVTEKGTISDTTYNASILAAITYTRGKISPVPGSGGVLGAAVYGGTVYAARNAADGLTAAIYKTSSAGWVLVKAGLIKGGKWRFIVANFTGSAKTISLFGCDGKNDPFYYDGTTYTKITGVYPTNATSVSSNTVGTGAQTYVLTEADRNYTAGQTVTIRDSATASNYMDATVTSWTLGTKTLVVNATAFGGAGTFTSWGIAKTDFSDRPFELLAHKDHLFLCFPSGQLKTSNLGDPLTYTTTASLFGMGDELTGLLSIKGDFLVIYCLNSISLLSGTSQIDWRLQKYSSASGAVFGTNAEVAGVGIHIDSTGVKSLQAMQTYGGYESSTFSREVSQTLEAIRPYILGAHPHKSSQQYRIYASTGKVLVCTVTTPSAVVTPQDAAFSLSDYGRGISCAISGELADGYGVSFFGTSDGYVMREGVGTSFDGVAIDSSLRLPFNHFKALSSRKRFRKIVLELAAPSGVTVNFKQNFDYTDGQYPSTLNQTAGVAGSGGIFNIDSWNTFTWSGPLQTQAEADISGVGKNMGMLLWHSSATDPSFTLQGVLIHYSPLGMAR